MSLLCRIATSCIFRTPIEPTCKHYSHLPTPRQARPPPLPRTLSDRAPMTPPRISGVSLAPLPNLEHHHHHSFSGEKSPGASGAPKPLQRRPSLTHGVLGGKALPPHAALGAACGHACVAAAPAPAATVGASVAHGAASFSCGGGIGTSSQLIAEGRSIARSVTIDPWIVAYMDINGTDADSVCATPPPRLNMQSLARSDSNGAFGPLSPWPLSPSILTVCGQLGVDDHFADNGSLELVDMRTCQSPKLPPV
ncbi:hypothetical protein VOLCADRAFT_108033 [Volvox carteri f. nagariensis]|uniref:Uncharacterized protein n=1 Tax=Volvox carteri f. nagariensis TaxID=3068 RepID=D8UHV3_VOLCA|nr:uncharacterized protein VOLCADRAFT_108033 [Volvox carteri f. nagariensis]EFJ40704.1 hypothetical protein VOLCADRAFT_108033 [Volvox carteri f. nagariensis]|eukprot:XP_002958250.1 hypothetical protein VOLCADRAFT_108033 [Volvox carteri f. nagariensis]